MSGYPGARWLMTNIREISLRVSTSDVSRKLRAAFAAAESAVMRSRESLARARRSTIERREVTRAIHKRTQAAVSATKGLLRAEGIAKPIDANPRVSR